jgi:hydrogenase nickel incorporation protein HypA/HybF
MHEMSIVESLLEQVRTFVPDGATLQVIHLEVGALEHLDPELMRDGWIARTEGTPLAGSALEMTRVPLRVRCRACGNEYAPEDAALLLCPSCGAALPDVLQGSGVVLRSLEVDQPVA